MSWDNNCIDCDKLISDEYERCYDCNEVRNSEMLKFRVFEIVVERNASWLVKLEEGLVGKQEWFPKSEVQLDGDFIWAPRWLAERKEIDGFAV